MDVFASSTFQNVNPNVVLTHQQIEAERNDQQGTMYNRYLHPKLSKTSPLENGPSIPNFPGSSDVDERVDSRRKEIQGRAEVYPILEDINQSSTSRQNRPGPSNGDDEVGCRRKEIVGRGEVHSVPEDINNSSASSLSESVGAQSENIPFLAQAELNNRESNLMPLGGNRFPVSKIHFVHDVLANEISEILGLDMAAAYSYFRLYEKFIKKALSRSRRRSQPGPEGLARNAYASEMGQNNNLPAQEIQMNATRPPHVCCTVPQERYHAPQVMPLNSHPQPMGQCLNGMYMPMGMQRIPNIPQYNNPARAPVLCYNNYPPPPRFNTVQSAYHGPENMARSYQAYYGPPPNIHPDYTAKNMQLVQDNVRCYLLKDWSIRRGPNPNDLLISGDLLNMKDQSLVENNHVSSSVINVTPGRNIVRTSCCNYYLIGSFTDPANSIPVEIKTLIKNNIFPDQWQIILKMWNDLCPVGLCNNATFYEATTSVNDK